MSLSQAHGWFLDLGASHKFLSRFTLLGKAGFPLGSGSLCEKEEGREGIY